MAIAVFIPTIWAWERVGRLARWLAAMMWQQGRRLRWSRRRRLT